jgi:hypothetical protein
LPGKTRPALTAEIISSIEEIQKHFHQLGTSIAKSIASATFPLPPLPDWLHDWIAATKGDREAAERLSKMVPATRKVSPDILTDSVLDVLRNTERALPVYLYRDGQLNPWHDENSGLKSLTPDDRLPYEVLEWFKVEVANAVNCRCAGEPYVPKVRFSQEPDEGTPFPLWVPQPKNLHRGRPKESDKYPTPEAVLDWLAPYVRAILEDGRYASLAAVAGEMGRHGDSIKHHYQKFFPDWASVLKKLREQ